MGHPAFERQNIVAPEVLKSKRHLEASIASDLHRLQSLDFLESIYESGTGVFLIGQYITANGHTGKAINRVWMLRKGFHVGLKASDKALVLFDLLREVAQEVVLQTILLTLMIGFHQLQPSHIYIQVHLFLNAFVTGTERLDLRIRQSGFVDIVAGPHRRFGGHDLRDKLLLVLQGLP